MPRCEDCDDLMIPIYYGYVDHAIIQKVIFGDVHIGYLYGLENFFCKKCKKSVQIK
jgi:hypothetical protein